jgi:hypothetical protein
MKRTITFCSIALLAMLLMVGVSYAQTKNMMKLSVGDQVYACNCGAKCDCDMLSDNPGKCVCGEDLVKAEVTKVEEGMVTLKINGQERTFKTTPKYACNCGSECECVTISQKPGKCTCGMPMKKVETK